MVQYLLAHLPTRRDDEGATAVEYGLMIAFIAMALILVAAALGDNVAGLFDSANTEVVNNGANDAEPVTTP